MSTSEIIIGHSSCFFFHNYNYLQAIPELQAGGVHVIQSVHHVRGLLLIIKIITNAINTLNCKLILLAR